MQVIVDQLLTSYELQGKGPLVLFLHGWGDAAKGSSTLRKQLAKHYTVLAPDLPGFGNTQAPAGAWDLDDYAKFTATLLTKLELDQPYAVIGHSNGGAIAVRAIATGQLTPQKLVLLAAAGIRSGQSFRRALLQIVAKTGNIATIGLPERYRRTLRQQLYSSAGSDLLVVEGMEETFKKTVKQDVQADAAKIDLPALLIFGKNDRAVTPAMAMRYEQTLPHATLHMLEAGHFVHLDNPEKTQRLIEDFLA